MSNPEKIKRSIREIVDRKQNVTLAEIERVMNQLKDHCAVSSVENDHQRMYAIDVYGSASARIIQARSRSRRST